MVTLRGATGAAFGVAVRVEWRERALEAQGEGGFVRLIGAATRAFANSRVRGVLAGLGDALPSSSSDAEGFDVTRCGA
jgi:hypothetical protein